MSGQVYHKCNDCNLWKCPGTVVGKGNTQILVKHGGQCVRVHPCRLQLKNKYQSNNINSSPTSSSFLTTQLDKSTALLKKLNIEKQIDRNVSIDSEFEDIIIKNRDVNENVSELAKSTSNLSLNGGIGTKSNNEMK